MKRLWWIIIFVVVAFIIIYLATRPSEVEEAGTMPDAEDFTLAEVGFDTPESILFDAQANLYYVSNIAGQPLEKDGNGFISKVSPEGELVELKWISGGEEGVELNAPKGMAVVGDVLYVTDIDVIRMFERTTGKPLGMTVIEESGFLNDLVAAPGGLVYVTDSGTGEGERAIFRLEEDTDLRTIADKEIIPRPNGLEVIPSALVMVTYEENKVFKFPFEGGEPEIFATTPKGGLDGVEFTRDGDLLVSSWADSAVYRIDGDGEVSTLFSGIPSPADIGYDAQRNRVLIPVFTQNRIEARVLPE